MRNTFTLPNKKYRHKPWQAQTHNNRDDILISPFKENVPLWGIWLHWPVYNGGTNVWRRPNNTYIFIYMYNIPDKDKHTRGRPTLALHCILLQLTLVKWKVKCHSYFLSFFVMTITFVLHCASDQWCDGDGYYYYYK